jgi:hypothetical protein
MALGKGARIRFYGRLVQRGLLRAERGKILGIVPRHSWPTRDAAHENAIRADVLNAVRNAATDDRRTGALVSLLLALNAVHKAVNPGAAGFQSGR